MSAPKRLPLQDRSNLQSNLQIRVVPYSPPRLSSDHSFSSHLQGGACSPVSRLSPANVELHDTQWAQHHPPEPVSELSNKASHSLESYRRTANQDAARHRAITPRRPSTSSSTRRLKHVVNVHADKTFSLMPQVEYESSSIYSSSILNSTITNITYGRNSSLTYSNGTQSSTLQPQLDDSAPTSPEMQKTPPKPTEEKAAGASSPWNYEFIGGLRKVQQQTPESEFTVDISPINSPRKVLFPPPGVVKYDSPSGSMLIPRKPLPKSYTSSPEDSNVTNFSSLKHIRPNTTSHDSPSPDFVSFSPSSSQNYRIFGDSGSSDCSLGSQSRPRTENSEPNYVQHSGPPSPSMPETPGPRLQPAFSRESLIVPPLNTARKLFPEKIVSVKPPQRGSSPKFLAAWSAMMDQDAARALFGSRIYPPRYRTFRTHSRSGASTAMPRVNKFRNQPPLSTVFSEGEVNDERLYRSISCPAGEISTNCKSPEMIVDDLVPDEYSYPQLVTPASEPIDWPQATHGKGKEIEMKSSNFHFVGDEDEHGDGLTDLRDLLHRRPSRKGRFPGMISHYASDRNLRSSASARATNWTIPAWARLYYGSGEHRTLMHQASRESIRSEYAGSQVANSRVERFGSLSRHQRGGSFTADGGPAIPAKWSYPELAWARTLKKQTSSLWSPHLRRDKRASTYGIWDPPSGALSVEGCITARKNVQVVLFMSGFLFPIAWMIAAFLPLPTNRILLEKDFPSTSHIDLAEDDSASPTQLAKEVTLYNRAKWWRDLNRAMAVIGLLIVGAFAVLIALGVQQRW